MKKFAGRLSTFLVSRVALNGYFWIFMFVISFVLGFNGTGKVYAYPAAYYYLFRTLTTLLIAALLYANNLWLLPHYFIKNKKGKYFLLLATITYATSLCMCVIFAFTSVHFPQIHTEDVSVTNALTIRLGSPSRWLILYQAISWSFSFSLLLFIFSLAWYMHEYQRQKRVTEEAQKKQVEAELLFLKSQINPHFLFNTLNNLYTLTIKKSDEAPDVVAKLSTILRYLLYESDTISVHFDKEKEMMQAYIDLEMLRLSNKDNIDFTITTDGAHTCIPPLLWVPVLENVFKHGTRYISEQYTITYRFTVQDNQLSIYSKNAFKTPHRQNSEASGGIGLTNLQKRLALLYPGKHKIETGQEGDLFVTNIQIQLN